MHTQKILSSHPNRELIVKHATLIHKVYYHINKQSDQQELLMEDEETTIKMIWKGMPPDPKRHPKPPYEPKHWHRIWKIENKNHTLPYISHHTTEEEIPKIFFTPYHLPKYKLNQQPYHLCAPTAPSYKITYRKPRFTNI